MLVLIKLGLILCCAVAVSATVQSETAADMLYGTLCTRAEADAYVRELTLRHMREHGDDPAFIEFVRRHP